MQSPAAASQRICRRPVRRDATTIAATMFEGRNQDVS